VSVDSKIQPALPSIVKEREPRELSWEVDNKTLKQWEEPEIV
jgi:hypothetical protein